MVGILVSFWDGLYNLNADRIGATGISTCNVAVGNDWKYIYIWEWVSHDPELKFCLLKLQIDFGAHGLQLNPIYW